MAIYTKGRRKRVFISGPITGVPDYMKKFKAAEDMLAWRGFLVVNPAKVNGEIPFSMPWDAYMSITLTILKQCDAIYQLFDWRQSPGALVEYEYAKKLNLEVFEAMPCDYPAEGVTAT